jgi:AraC family transcriptional regulator, regulatory protein of adaptative response / methylated-DNA-[protein]-cysteine methyltransferase
MASVNLAMRQNWPGLGIKMKSDDAAAHGSRITYAAGAGGAGELEIGEASYGRRGKGASVRFTIADSPYGTILIAATAAGVCWIGLCDSVERLEAELRGDLAAATISRDASGLDGLAPAVVDYVSGRTHDIALPIDLRATPFQIAVWQELCAIPRGETRSYGEIAARLRRPDAARAVGHANGANPLAIVIPCHRAIGSDGSLTGYRWGVEYKRRLLDRERALAQSALAFS